MQGAAIKAENPTSPEGEEISPVRVECQWCGKFLFKTYFAQTKLEIKCFKCRKDMRIEMDTRGLRFSLL
jgi:Zn finger protein HypA/HybF involved in hydrogenase expression